MRVIFSLRARLRALKQRRKLEAEMHEEMRLHLEQRTEEYCHDGLTLEEAARAAAIEFGSLASLKEEAREARGWDWTESLLRNVRYARRQLASSKLFSAVTIGSLSLFLGINAAAFAVLDSLVLNPLPFPYPDRIVEVYNSLPKVGVAKFCSNVGQYLDFKANVSAFETAGLWEMHQDAFADADRAKILVTATVTPEVFDLLGVHPSIGRFFDLTSSRPNAPRVVVLTESFWAEHFHRAPSVVGKTIRLNGEEYEIVGVAPAAMEKFAPQVQALRPLTWDPAEPVLRSGYSPMLIARLKAGSTVALAQSQTAALEKAFYDGAAPRTRAFIDQTGQTVRVDLLRRQRAEAFAHPLFLLQASAAAVLLVAFANILDLFIARINAREMEFHTRAALGASRKDIVFQLGVESGVIGIFGLLGGLAVAEAGLALANHFVAILSPNTVAFHLQTSVVAATAAASLLLIAVTTIITSSQVLQTSWRRYRETGTRTQSRSMQSRKLAGYFVVGQIAFGLMVTVIAILLLQSFLRAAAVPPGFNADRLLSLRLAVPESKEHTLPIRLDEELRKLPGIESCVVTAAPFYLVPPVNASMPLGAVHIRGYEAGPGDGLPSAYYCGVTANYADVLGLNMLRGRWFSEPEIASGRYVVIDETFSKHYFSGQDPIGQKMVINRAAPTTDSDWLEIIGVANNVLHNGIGDKSGQPFVYLSRAHTPFFGAASILIKTERPTDEVLKSVRETVAAVDSEIPVFDNKPERVLMEESIQDRRALMFLLVSLAGCCVFLASLGIYGSLSYDISRRIREIGIRLAIGTPKKDIMKMLMTATCFRATTGVLIGLACGLLLHRYVASLLFNVSPVDVGAYTTSAVVVLIGSLIACLIPAARASRIDPVVALRAE